MYLVLGEVNTIGAEVSREMNHKDTTVIVSLDMGDVMGLGAAIRLSSTENKSQNGVNVGTEETVAKSKSFRLSCIEDATRRGFPGVVENLPNCCLPTRCSTMVHIPVVAENHALVNLPIGDVIPR